MVSTVTIYGVNENISPDNLVDISMKYPFVEWGIDLCSDYVYPEYWIGEVILKSDQLRLQGVLKGRWERDMLHGILSVKDEHPGAWNAIKRIQVNTDIDNTESLIESLALIPDKEAILKTSLDINPITTLSGIRLNAYPLFSNLSTYLGYCGYIVPLNKLEYVLEQKGNFWIGIDELDVSDYSVLEIERVLDKIEDYIAVDTWFQTLFETTAIQRRLSQPPSSIPAQP
jgi:hypothetical protein